MKKNIKNHFCPQKHPYPHPVRLNNKRRNKIKEDNLLKSPAVLSMLLIYDIPPPYRDFHLFGNLFIGFIFKTAQNKCPSRLFRQGT